MVISSAYFSSIRKKSGPRNEHKAVFNEDVSNMVLSVGRIKQKFQASVHDV